MIADIIRTIVKIVIGLILLDGVPGWLGLKGVFAFIVKLLGVLVILWALLDWI